MTVHRIGKTLRVFFAGTSAVLWLGIALTGFATAHWLLYLPAIFLLFAAATAICPGIIITRKIMGEEG